MGAIPGALSSVVPVGGMRRGCPSTIVGGSGAACANPAKLLRLRPREMSIEADLLLGPPARSLPGESGHAHMQVSILTPGSDPCNSVRSQQVHSSCVAWSEGQQVAVQLHGQARLEEVGDGTR